MKVKWSMKRKILFCICLLVFMTTACILLNWWIETKKAVDTNEKLIKEVVSEQEVEFSREMGTLFKVDFEKLNNINSQVVGWIRIPKTNISYPILQAMDNEFYLKHNIYKEKSSSGSVFLDYQNKADFSDENTVLYGHNMKNDTMFAQLKKLDTLGANIIQIYLPNETRTYKVFSIYTIEAEDYSIQTDIAEDEKENFIQTLQNRSRKIYEIENRQEKILTLSTCHTENHRTLVHAILQE